MAERNISLRVLYTINSSPQYILARSLSSVSVTLIPPASSSSHSSESSTPQHLYASVSLKTCLSTISRSSPELTHDNSRDFSLYVLDPLESNSVPAPVCISNSNGETFASKASTSSLEQPRGVAVGLGLMSWALRAEDSDTIYVVGTLVKQLNGQDALEVIFALRETIAMKKQTWNPPSSQPSTSRDDSVETFSSSQSNVKLVQGQPTYNQGTFISSYYSMPTSSSSTTQTRIPTDDLTRETLASIQMRNKPKVKPPKPVRQSTVPVTESDELMNADTYIGPLKKKGRPKASSTFQVSAIASGSGSNAAASSSKEVIVIDGSDSDVTASAASTIITTNPPGKPIRQDTSKKKKRSTQQPMTTPFTKDPLVRRINPVPELGPPNSQIKTEPQSDLTLLDIVTFLAAPSDPNPKNVAILKTLSNIDSHQAQPEATTNPHLVTALQQLLAGYDFKPAPLQQQPTPVSTPTHVPSTASTPKPTPTPVPAFVSTQTQEHITSAHSTISVQVKHQQQPSHSQEAGSVILDKENVDPVPARRWFEKDPESGKPSNPTSVAGPSSGAGSTPHPERPLQSLGLSTRSNENLASRSQNTVPISNSSGERAVRKRTLSDFMDERENGRNKDKAKTKERERVEKRDGHRHASMHRTAKHIQQDALRHYPRLVNQPRQEQPSCYYRLPLESMPMTSPSRLQTDSDNESGEGAPLTQSASVSRLPTPEKKSPSPRGRASASSPVRGPKHEPRKKYVVPEWARTTTSTQPRLSEEARMALKEAEVRRKEERNAARKRQPAFQARIRNKGGVGQAPQKIQPAPLAPPAKLDASKGPSSAQNNRPMVAASDITFPFLSSRYSSPSPSSLATAIPKTPKTPVRDRTLQKTPGSSLFTPITGSGSLFGSSLSSLRTPLQQHQDAVLTSPLANRKKVKFSPTQLSLIGKAFSAPRFTIETSSTPTSSDSKDLGSNLSTDMLDKELETVMEDLSCPPSSLPIASSDTDFDNGSNSGQMNLVNPAEILPVKQHWAGLPPSSPPAPSSPMVFPEEDDEEEMDEIPIATSDSEADTYMNGCDNTTTSLSNHNTEYIRDLAPAEDCDLTAFFTSNDLSSISGHVSSADLFEQFTNLNDQSDVFTGVGEMPLDPDLQAMFQNGLDNIDFTEFWETFKPLVDENTQQPPPDQPDQPNTNATNPFEVNQNNSLSTSLGYIDHAKLAEDMQSLLSGCLM